MTTKKQLLHAAMSLAQRSDASKHTAIIQSSATEAARLHRRSHIQQLASLRLMRNSGAYSP